MSMVLVLFYVLLARITFAIEKCGVPAKPSHGHLWPDKPFYDHGDKVRVKCEENYVLFGKEAGIQTCYYGVWEGKPPACLENLAYRRNLKHFGSPSGGKAISNGGSFIYDVVDAREAFFFDLFFNKTTIHTYVYFHGNFTVTDQHGTELPFEQTVLAFNTNIHFYEQCLKSQSGDYYECITPDERYFKGAKVEINLVNKTIDMTKNFIQVKLQLENSGFVVLDVADKDCGTPPVPFRGSVSTTANKTEAVYSCEHGYTLQGESVQTCDIANFPEISWLSKIPVCLENSQNMPASSDRILTTANIIVISVVSTVGCVVVILIVAGIMWFSKKTRLQTQNHPNNVCKIEVTRNNAVASSDLNRTDVHNYATNHMAARQSNSYRPMPFPPAVTYLTVTDNPYSHSTTSSESMYEYVNDAYEYVDMASTTVSEEYEYMDVANITLPTSQS